MKVSPRRLGKSSRTLCPKPRCHIHTNTTFPYFCIPETPIIDKVGNHGSLELQRLVQKGMPSRWRTIGPTRRGDNKVCRKQGQQDGDDVCHLSANIPRGRCSRRRSTCLE